VLEIINKTANAVCSQYRDADLVCPPSLQHGLFTVAAADNIDHNLTTAQSSFHGTAISLMQLPGADFNLVISAEKTPVFQDASCAVADIILPLSYTEIQPCILPKSDPVIPVTNFETCFDDSITNDDYAWLNAVKNGIDVEDEPDTLSWAAFHAENATSNDAKCAISALLPLFRHNANSAEMMRHCMVVVKAAIESLNPGQTPVMTADQPLYALIKQIQWHWPDRFGEDKFVILLGGLHTEMAALRMVGHFLNGSGWTQCLIQAGVATVGVAESFISASHVKRTRYAHTVTAAALYVTLHRSYEHYCHDNAGDAVISFGKWRADLEKSSAQFHFWSLALELELLVLAFVRSLRSGNFHLYIDSLQKLAPWFFAFDQTNYARWLPVHIRDMLLLEKNHPEVYSQFRDGKFSLSKSKRKFSSIAIDQAHEQLNAVIKGDGGAIGLTENEASLCRWTVTGPEIVRIPICSLLVEVSRSANAYGRS